MRSVRHTAHASQSRRHFLLALAASVPAVVLAPRHLLAADPHAHPDPRPNITGEHILDAGTFTKDQDAIRAYEMAREIPDVLDGLYCYCRCQKTLGHRSLLSCYESKQAAGCWSCQGQMKLAYKLHHRGQTLTEIRAEEDKQFG
jgi:hypothetical protein